MPKHLICNNFSNSVASELNQLLNDVVAKDVSYQVEEVWQNFCENNVFEGLVAVRHRFLVLVRFKCLLDVPAAVLVYAALVHMRFQC